MLTWLNICAQKCKKKKKEVWNLVLVGDWWPWFVYCCLSTQKPWLVQLFSIMSASLSHPLSPSSFFSSILTSLAVHPSAPLCSAACFQNKCSSNSPKVTWNKLEKYFLTCWVMHQIGFSFPPAAWLFYFICKLSSGKWIASIMLSLSG